MANFLEPALTEAVLHQSVAQHRTTRSFPTPKQELGGYLIVPACLMISSLSNAHSISIAQSIAKPKTAMHSRRPLCAAPPITPLPSPACFGPMYPFPFPGRSDCGVALASLPAYTVVRSPAFPSVAYTTQAPLNSEQASLFETVVVTGSGAGGRGGELVGAYW